MPGTSQAPDCRVPNWLYVAGAGRSGTTLLGMVLAREPGVFNCGELIHLWSRLSANALCQCEAPVTRCEVWADVAVGVRRQLGRALRVVEHHEAGEVEAGRVGREAGGLLRQDGFEERSGRVGIAGRQQGSGPG